MANSTYLLAGFESRPGKHPWQGEHVGKWLHAASLAYEQTQDEKLGKALQETVQRLLATQEANGYLGTYAEKRRFYAVPADGRSWDIWSHRYNLYGLLTYERFHPDERVLRACERMVDLLSDSFGQGKADITRNGTRRGISSTTLLESVMMLYERTKAERFLRFAEHIVACSEKAPGLCLMDAMLKQEDVSGPGQGKAYQLMANLLGYLHLHEHTGEERYLKTVQNAWENIKTQHLYTSGGPWTRHMPYNGNQECFARPRDFDPGNTVVETCSVTTWVQLNLHLLELTGQARYAVEAERAVFNCLMAAQYREGIDWCYFTKANEDHRPFQDKITCCASSGPRALEMFSHYRIGEWDSGISLASLVPGSAILPASFGQAKIRITGNYPFNSKIGIRFEEAGAKRFALEFRDPGAARLTCARINGAAIALSKNQRGFYPISRAWKRGDEITLEFTYQLQCHLETPKPDQRWVAFSYGPWALAQTIDKDTVLTEPFIGKDLQSKAAAEWLEALPSQEDATSFRIKNTQIRLGPYYCAGSRDTGPRSYFRF
jgi:uncharacterized protein